MEFFRKEWFNMYIIIANLLDKLADILVPPRKKEPVRIRVRVRR
jgi:hypothetical protein